MFTNVAQQIISVYSERPFNRAQYFKGIFFAAAMCLVYIKDVGVCMILKVIWKCVNFLKLGFHYVTRNSLKNFTWEWKKFCVGEKQAGLSVETSFL